MPSHYECLSDLDIQIIQFTTISNGYTNLKEILDTNFELGSLLLQNGSNKAATKPHIVLATNIPVALTVKPTHNNNEGCTQSCPENKKQQNNLENINIKPGEKQSIGSQNAKKPQEKRQALKRKQTTNKSAEKCDSVECKKKRTTKSKPITTSTTNEHLPALSLHRQAVRSSPVSVVETKV